jgi:CHAT domain-containing protein
LISDAYLELVRALLECEGGTEADILAVHPELVDEGLVMALLGVARAMGAENDPERTSTIEWLTGFAAQLTQTLGLDTESNSGDTESQLKFLMTIFQAIAESSGNPQVIYPLLRDNLTLLDESLIPMLKAWHQTTSADVDVDGKQFLAAVLNTFANLIAQFPLGSRSINLEIAIACYELALSVYTLVAYPEDWATTQNNLANSYSNRIRGERAANLERSIACYELALSVRTLDAYPEDWAGTQNNLAIAYSQRIRGERAANLEQAVACYELALSVYAQDADPEKWAMTQNNRAIAYSNRIRGERAANLERSISCYELALSVRTREAYPEDWAMTQMNLANAYRSRIRGERAANLERSIECYELALSVRTREAYPEQWASTQMNLAAGYSDRIWGERAANLERSIACYELALSVYTPDAYPEDWASTQMNLANTYSQKIRGERAANLERSIACYELALSVYTVDAYPEDWAMTQMNLAIAYSDRIRGERAANLERSIECYELALSVYTLDTYPERWAMTQENLAILYAEEGKKEKAIRCYEQALTIFTPAAFPINALKADRGLGNIYFAQGEWQLAVDAYAVAIQAAETSRNWATDKDERQRIIREAISVYERTIQAYVNIGRIDLAIITSERARSRQLVDFMRVADLYTDAEIPAEVRTYLVEYEALERQIQVLQSLELSDTFNPTNQLTTSTRSSRTLTQAGETVKDLEAQKQAVWRKIWTLDPELAAKQQIVPIDLATIQGLITTPNTAILSFYTTDDDTHIFIITQKGEPQIHTCKGQGWQQFQSWLGEVWLGSYYNNKSNWLAQIPTNLLAIAEKLELNTLVSKLDGITELIIIPHLYLHQIPFAALPLLGGLLGDKFTIHYTPSCQILKYCHDRPPLDQTQHGTIENADGTLPGAEFEGAFVANLFELPDRYRLQGRTQATIAGFQSLMEQTERPVTNLHFASHAQSRLDNPLESALQLADGNLGLDRLIISRYSHLHEVFLSCCETHLGATKITDDVLTIGTGFLCAGARSVISTLWSVDDIATALFSIFYYQNRYANHSRAKSLKMAQVRLRNLVGEEFKLNYYDDLEFHLKAYAKANRADRQKLNARFDLGEIVQSTFERDYDRLTHAYYHALDIIDSLDRYCRADRPFAHPYYWAAFTCQGLG